jgi:hypothetical protein
MPGRRYGDKSRHARDNQRFANRFSKHTDAGAQSPVAFRGDHTHHVDNGLLLRADLHTLFDRGLLAVNSASWTAVVAPAMRAGSYGGVHGRTVRPMKDGGRPSVIAIDEHRRDCMF